MKNCINDWNWIFIQFGWSVWEILTHVWKTVWNDDEHDAWHYVWKFVISYPNFRLNFTRRPIRPILRHFKRQILLPLRRKKRRRFLLQVCQVGDMKISNNFFFLKTKLPLWGSNNKSWMMYVEAVAACLICGEDGLGNLKPF